LIKKSVELPIPFAKQNEEIRKRISELLDRNLKNDVKTVIAERSSIINSDKKSILF
jgi:hypothetical protein